METPKDKTDTAKCTMDITKYQKNAQSFATGGGKTAIYSLLGAMEELSELVEKVDFINLNEGGYNPLTEDIRHCLMGIVHLGNDCGRVAKFIRKNWDKFGADLQCRINSYKIAEGADKELGDIAWFLAALTQHLVTEQDGRELPAIMEQNIAKLTDRKNRGVIVGSGDNR